MAQPALSPHGGTSPGIHLRLPAEDADRIDQLAAQRGLTRSEAVREMIYAALEAGGDAGPPRGGKAA